MRDYYLYVGTLSMSEGYGQSIILADLSDKDKPPLALKVPCRALAKYLDARSTEDAEERYITQGWLYDRNLFLQAVVIPSNKAGWPAKVIACSNPEEISMDAVIFGSEELIEDREPEPLGEDAFRKWVEYRNTFGLRPRNVFGLGSRIPGVEDAK